MTREEFDKVCEQMAREWCEAQNCDYGGHEYDVENNALKITAISRKPIEYITMSTTIGDDEA